MANWEGVKDFLEEAAERASEVAGLIQEIVEPVHPPFDPRTQMSSCMMMTSSFIGSRLWGVSGQFEDEVFRGQESIPNELFHKRVEEFRKKHPDTFEPIEKMHEIVYGTREWEENGSKVVEETRIDKDGGLIRQISRMMKGKK